MSAPPKKTFDNLKRLIKSQFRGLTMLNGGGDESGIELLDKLLQAHSENEHLEFKEAKQHFKQEELVKYCAALANEGGGCLCLGVSDRHPRKVVGTASFANLDQIKHIIFQQLSLRVEVFEVQHAAGRVLIFKIPSRPAGQPIGHRGSFYMRLGESVMPMSADQLRQIFQEGRPDWCLQTAKGGCEADEVIALLDTQSYFELLRRPYPQHATAVLERFEDELIIRKAKGGWEITNLGALLFAKKLASFGRLARKAPRVIQYAGQNKLMTQRDKIGSKGYANGFNELLEYITGLLPANEVIGKALRQTITMYPEEALRELIANALIHQALADETDWPTVEIYADRIEISNPGLPILAPDRFIDGYRSRNERLADLMRRLGFCEEKGSGVDRVIFSAEVYQLPAPDFRIGEQRTIVVLFSHKDFGEMSRLERVRAAYQHCCLRYVTNRKMTNQSLRERFTLPKTKSEAVSRIIRDALDEQKIRMNQTDSSAKKLRNYLPYWA